MDKDKLVELVRDCYPCDGRGWWRTSSTQFTYRCNNCRGTGISPTWALSDGSDPQKRAAALRSHALRND